MGILEIIGLIMLAIVAIPTALVVGTVLLIAGFYVLVIIYALVIQVVKEVKELFNY